MGLFIYVRVGETLLSSVDQNLDRPGREATQHAQRGRRQLLDEDVSDGPTVAQARSPTDRSSTRTRGAPAVVPDSTRRGGAARPPRSHDGSLRGLRGTWRLDRRAGPRCAASPATLVVGRSLAARDETLDRLGREFLLAGPSRCSSRSSPATAWRRRRSARSRRCAGVPPPSPRRRPDERLPVPPARDEISALAVTLNDMLARLEASFEHERRFVADASHELRTPLALLEPSSSSRCAGRDRARARADARPLGRRGDRAAHRLAEDLLLIARGRPGPAADPAASVCTRRRAPRARPRALRRPRGRSAGRSTSTDERGPELLADPVRLEQATRQPRRQRAPARGRRRHARRPRAGRRRRAVRDGRRARAAARLHRARLRPLQPAGRRPNGGGPGSASSIVELIARAHGGEAHASRPRRRRSRRLDRDPGRAAGPQAGSRPSHPAATHRECRPGPAQSWRDRRT